MSIISNRFTVFFLLRQLKNFFLFWSLTFRKLSRIKRLKKGKWLWIESCFFFGLRNRKLFRSNWKGNVLMETHKKLIDFSKSCDFFVKGFPSFFISYDWFITINWVSFFKFSFHIFKVSWAIFSYKMGIGRNWWTLPTT